MYFQTSYDTTRIARIFIRILSSVLSTRRIVSCHFCDDVRMVKIYKRLNKSMTSLEYYRTRSWTWTQRNLDCVVDALSPSDLDVSTWPCWCKWVSHTWPLGGYHPSQERTLCKNILKKSSILVKFVTLLWYLQTFYLDVRDVQWDSYITDFVCGVKRFVLKENPKSLENAKSRLRK